MAKRKRNDLGLDPEALDRALVRQQIREQILDDLIAKIKKVRKEATKKVIDTDLASAARALGKVDAYRWVITLCNAMKEEPDDV